MPTLISIFGPPGSGKTNLTKGLAKHLECPSACGGDVVRALARKDDAIRERLERGETISEDAVMPLITESIRQLTEGTATHCVFDGTPRNIEAYHKTAEMLAGAEITWIALRLLCPM